MLHIAAARLSERHDAMCDRSPTRRCRGPNEIILF